MNPTDHQRLRESLADYVLDRLEADERARLEGHLATCAECQQEARRTNELVGALRAAAQPLASTIDVPIPVPTARLESAVLDRVAREAARELEARKGGFERVGARGDTSRDTSRWLRPLLAVAAAVAILAGGVAIGTRIAPAPIGPPFEVLSFQPPPPGVDASGKLIAHTWGTEVSLVISGLDAGHEYRVTFVRSDGSEVAGGTFIGVSDRPIVCSLNGALLREEATLLRISDELGQPVLQADLSVAARLLNAAAV